MLFNHGHRIRGLRCNAWFPEVDYRIFSLSPNIRLGCRLKRNDTPLLYRKRFLGRESIKKHPLGSRNPKDCFLWIPSLKKAPLWVPVRLSTLKHFIDKLHLFPFITMKMHLSCMTISPYLSFRRPLGRFRESC